MLSTRPGTWWTPNQSRDMIQGALMGTASAIGWPSSSIQLQISKGYLTSVVLTYVVQFFMKTKRDGETIWNSLSSLERGIRGQAILNPLLLLLEFCVGMMSSTCRIRLSSKCFWAFGSGAKWALLVSLLEVIQFSCNTSLVQLGMLYWVILFPDCSSFCKLWRICMGIPMMQASKHKSSSFLLCFSSVLPTLDVP